MVISLLKRGAALLTLLALVVGAPYLLWVLGRDLLPDRVPGWSDIWDSLTAQDTGALFMGALVLAGFVAWAVFTLCVLIDIAGRLTGRTWTLRIPGLRVPQAAASSLIGAVLAGSALLGVTGTAAAAAAPLPPLPQAAATAVAVTAAHVEEAQQHTRPTPTPTTQPSAPVGPVWTVREGDTLWSIAVTTTGDPLRYQEIFELNHAAVQPDGGRLDTPETWLEVGWTLRLPAGAAAAAQPGAVHASADPAPVLVQPGDTLSQIAQDELGDATRYPELAAANKIVDPDVIDVGQVIVIPQPAPAADPVPPGGSGPATSSPAPAAQPEDAVAADPESAGEAQVSLPPRSTSENPAAGSRETAASSAAVSTPPGATPAEQPTGAATAAPASASPAAESAASAAEAPDSSDHGSIAVLAGVTALAASAGWLALLAARRRGDRRRGPGRQAAPARLGAARTERRLREKAGTVDAGWLDTALRCLAVTLSSQPAADYPDVVAAYFGPHQLRLQLAEPTPAPAPFEADGDEWVLAVTADLSVTDTAAAECMAPLPTLASIGSRGDQTVLLDLERAGAVCLQGDRRACRDLMNHLALELAHNGWSDGLTVSLVGWGKALTVLNPDRLVHAASIADVIRDLRARLAETRDSEDSLGTTVLAGRVGDVVGDSWMPQVLLIDATDDDEHQIVMLQQILGEMAQAGRATTAVVMTGAPSVGGVAEITVTADGELRFPELWGPARLTAARLGDTEIGELAEQFHLAEHVDEPIPAAAEEESWAQGMDASGALLNPVTALDSHQGTDSGTAENEAAAAAADSGADDTTGDAAQASSARVVPVRPISAAAAAQLASVLAADPDLDADLAEWASETVLRPRVGVLGPVEVRAAGIAPPNRVARLSEVVTYLALHSAGVSADKFVTDLWPAQRQPAAGTRRQLIFDVRKWMGRDAAGEQFLPNANDGLYRLTARLLDAELLRRLRKRAQAKAAASNPSGALEDYTAALRLVRGRAMPEAEGQAYSWLANLDRMEDRRIPAWVTETAHEAAEIAFGLNDLDTARWASDIGHLSNRDSEIPICDLLLVAQASGNVEIAQALAWQILEVNSATVPEECAPRIFEIIHRVFPAGLRPVTT